MREKARYTVRYHKNEEDAKKSYFSVWKNGEVFGKLNLDGTMMDWSGKQFINIPNWELKRIRELAINSSASRAILIAWARRED